MSAVGIVGGGDEVQRGEKTVVDRTEREREGEGEGGKVSGSGTVEFQQAD